MDDGFGGDKGLFDLIAVLRFSPGLGGYWWWCCWADDGRGGSGGVVDQRMVPIVTASP